GGATGCAVRTDGTVFCWGFDGLAQLGDNGPYDPVQHPGARQVPGLPTSIKLITKNAATAFATDGTGAVWGWGDNTLGELGTGTLNGVKCPTTFDGGACVAPPATVPALAGSKVIATGAFSGLALKADESVVAWGRNSHGQ